MILIGLIATVGFKKQSISINLSLLKYLKKCYKNFGNNNFSILYFYCIFEPEWWSYKDKIGNLLFLKFL